MSKILSSVFIIMMLVAVASDLSAENYVNWRGGFSFEIPEGWEKADYRLVDAFLSITDTSREVFNYEAVYYPSASEIFAEEAYLVVTFDSTGSLTKRESDSVLRSIAETYTTDVYDAPIVQLMSDLVPGEPKMNRAEKSISVLTDMAYSPEAMKKLWLFMKLNDRGLISLYFYSPDSTYNQNKPVFDRIVNSLSFENLKEAATGDSPVFTGVGGDSLTDPDVASDKAGSESTGATESMGNIKDILLYGVIVIIVFGLIWNFVIAPRMKKKTTQSD